jgi:hypothetical protein
MSSSRFSAKAFFVALLVICTTIAASAQNKDIDPALLAKANAGNAVAEDQVGLSYLDGDGLPKDVTKAALWFRKAAEQGLSDAQYNLADAYYFGEGVPIDYVQSVLWDRKAAEQGDAGAQASLGGSYQIGQGVPQDYSQAAIWYRKAAEQGIALAQEALGLLYDDGQGVPQDYAESYFWLDIAAVGKVIGMKQEDLTAARDEAASHLTPADLSRVQERARKWFEMRPQDTDVTIHVKDIEAQREAREFAKMSTTQFAAPAILQGKTTDVKIIDRQNSESQYSYGLPGFSHAISTGDVNCNGSSENVHCSGDSTTNSETTDSREISYSVTGATFSLQLPDGRVVVVNCDSKSSFSFDYPLIDSRVVRRSCRMPIVDDIQAEFKGKNAKLTWSVSLDGKKTESETYKILGVFGN